MINILLLKKKFSKGEILCEEGDSGSEAYIIRDGYLAIIKRDGDQEVELAQRGPGEIVGEMSLIDDSPRSATLKAATDLEVEIITRKDLKEMFDKLPEQVAVIIRQLLERLRDANELVAGSLSDD